MARWPATLALAAVVACDSGFDFPAGAVTGTWGGANAGLIANDSAAHVHIGCTLGDLTGPLHIDADGRFDATGLYNVSAFPVDRGILHPARFIGQIIGRTMTLTVVLTDTTRQFGPVALTYGREPEMGPCPICRAADGRMMKARHDRGAAAP